jgi:hypothetical protein
LITDSVSERGPFVVLGKACFEAKARRVIRRSTSGFSTEDQWGNNCQHYHHWLHLLAFAGNRADMINMDISTIVAGVLVGNFLTLGIVFNIRALDVPNPPLKNIIFVLILMGVALVVGLAAAQSLPAMP